MGEERIKPPTLAEMQVALAHSGVKGMKWGVRKDERALSVGDKALNISQRSQVKIATAVSTLAAIGISSNAAATAFQLQTRWEHLQVIKAIADQAENSPFMNDASREAFRITRNRVVKGIISSAIATTAISASVGIVTHRTARAYFAPVHKVYGTARPKINKEIKQLGKDIKAGKKPKMTKKAYESEVSKIVNKHMTKDLNNVLNPFHELARSQLGLEHNTKKLRITITDLPNTKLASKLTVTTPNGLKLVKALKNVQHALIENDDPAPDMDLYFDYKFDEDGFITDWSSPTIEIANEMFAGTFEFKDVESSMQHSAIKISAIDALSSKHAFEKYENIKFMPK